MENSKAMFYIEYYELPSGDKPVKSFINSLDTKMRVKVLGNIGILAEYGNELRGPYSKAIGKGLFELRIKLASDTTRVLYFFYYDNRIILTNGFIKKSKKTPHNEIALALQYKADYERRQR